jgi:hypothetical protein
MTVPQTQYYEKGWGSDEIIQEYPNNTRVVHHTSGNVCTLAYAVTQKSARQILYQIGLKDFSAPMDIMLRLYCDAVDGRKTRSCFTTQPAYFEHFRPRGNLTRFSDMSEWVSTDGSIVNDQDFSANIRLSTKINLEKLTEGEGNLVDQFPDV